MWCKCSLNKSEMIQVKTLYFLSIMFIGNCQNCQDISEFIIVYFQYIAQFILITFLMSIIVRPIQAALTRNTSIITKMDPFCKIYLGGQCHQTDVCKNGGQSPTWSSTLIFNNSGDRNLRIQVWDRDEIGSNDLVGIGNLNLDQVLQQGLGNSLWVDLVYNGKNVGRVCLSIQMDQGLGMKGQMGVNPLNQGVGIGGGFSGQSQAGYGGNVNPKYQQGGF